MLSFISYPSDQDLFSYIMNCMIELAKPIRETPWLLDLGLTGAAGFLRMALWVEPRASNNLLGERWTYAQQHTDELIGRSPPNGKYSRISSALAMASASFRRGKEVSFEREIFGRPVMGVAMTAAVSTGRRRRGDNSCRVAIRTEEVWHSLDIKFQKAHIREQTREERRIEEGLLCDLITLLLIRHTIGLENPVLDAKWGFEDGDFVQEEGMIKLLPQIQKGSGLDNHETPFYQVLMPNDDIIPISELDMSQYVLFPGSFAPLHHGHERIARLAKQQTTKDILFQITAQHPAKGRIPLDELRARAAQLRFLWPVVLFETEGLYVEKSKRCPKTQILIGADVVYGLQDLRYYQQDRKIRDQVFSEIAQQQGSFLVAGREVDDVYETLYDIPIPPRYAPLFLPLGGKMSVSSTQLRKISAN